MKAFDNKGDIIFGLQRLCTLVVFVAIIALLATLLDDRGAQTAFSELGQKVIVVDAGHGGFDPGASSARGTREDKLNLAVAKYLREELEKGGAKVIMTRETHEAIASTKRQDMLKRRSIITEQNADIVVSIHMNKYSSASVKGHMVFYMKGSQRGELLAGFVQSTLDETLGTKKRKPNPGDYFILRSGEAPCIIVECGFLSNQDDEWRLKNKDHQRKLAVGIAKGVQEYFEYVKTLPEPTPTPASAPG